jgi:selenide,water dikinase
MAQLPRQNHPNLLVGYETSDDAGIYKLSEELALIQTLDFFTPIVDDPYYFGQIAAANALSDVYAMGGQPLTAMNIICFPIKEVSKEILKQILRGGLDKIHEAKAILVGGHSVEDPEIKYGLSITGTVHPDKILTNAEVRVGDALILTKPLGTGVIATAIKGKLASQEAIKNLIEVTTTLNDVAARVMHKFGVHACTDVTGFGLAGHLLEMAMASKKEIEIWTKKIPLIPEVLEYASMGLIPVGSYANKYFCANLVEIDSSLPTLSVDILFDAQTSGGLIIALPEKEAVACQRELKTKGIKEAAIIGKAINKHTKGKIKIMP